MGDGYGHESIDREIIKEYKRSSLRSLLNEYTDVIYQLSRGSGDTSYIHKSVEGYPSEDKFTAQFNALLREAQDPSFGDTLAGGKQEADAIVAPNESIMQKLLKYFSGGK